MIERLEAILSLTSRGFWRASWQASILVVVVIAIQMLFGKRLGARGRYALWSIVLLRLLLPALPESKFSVYSLIQRWRNTSHIAIAPLDFSTHVPIKAQNSVRASPQIASTPQPVPFWTMSRALMLLWISGLSALSLRVFASCMKLRRELRKLSHASDPLLLETAKQCAQTMRLRKCPPLLIGEATRTPAVVGFVRPKLVLPNQIIQRCDRAEIRLILMHELAHLKRHDLLVNWLITLATMLHWFNPIVWLAASRMRGDRELACDELVLARSDPRQARAYGLTLVKLIEILAPPRPQSTAQLVGILESTGPLQRRVLMIANFDAHRTARWGFVTGTLLLLLGCAALTDSAHGDPKAVKSAGPTTRPGELQFVESESAPQSAAELQAKLRQVLPEVRFDSMALADTMEYLRHESGINLVVQWRALEAAGIDRAVPVTLWLKRVTVEQAVDHVLNDAGGGTVRLDHTIARGAVIVSTEEDLAKDVTTVFYDVNDLLVSPDGKPIVGESAQKKIDELKKVIMDTIAPDTWRDAGGTVGAIDVFNNKLIITSTPKLQQQIDQLLMRLREKPTTQPRPLSS